MDPRCPVQGLDIAIHKARAAYEAAGLAQNFEVYFERNLGHSVSHGLDAQVNKFLDHHLLKESLV